MAPTPPHPEDPGVSAQILGLEKVLKSLHISKNVRFMEPNVGVQDMGPVDHNHQQISVESNSRQLVVIRSHQSKHDHDWEGVQGADYKVNVQDSPDLVCGQC